MKIWNNDLMCTVSFYEHTRSHREQYLSSGWKSKPITFCQDAKYTIKLWQASCIPLGAVKPKVPCGGTMKGGNFKLSNWNRKSYIHHVTIMAR